MEDVARTVEQAYVSVLPQPKGSREYPSLERPNHRIRPLLFAVAAAVTAGLPVVAGFRDPSHVLTTAICTRILAGTTPANGTTPAKNTSDIDWQSIQPSTDIQWVPCYDGHQCARLLLPLDYLSNDSSNAATAIAMRMIPARNRTNYRGTVLINPGGPSESGTAFMGSLGSYLSDTVGDSFDVLGFDPRGVGESTPRLDCFTSQSERDGWLAQESHRLLSVADDDLLNLYVARAQVLGARCAAASASKEDIAEHMSTASVATDMVNIIEKLGQEKLHYWGFSYGTVLGQYFAAMYPDKVGRMIFDGVYDGNNYRASLWDSNVYDSEAVINSIFTFCHQAGPDGCALYESTSAAIRERFFRVLNALKHNPVPIPLAQPPVVIGYKDIVNVINTFAYNPIRGYPSIVEAIYAIETANQTTLAELAAHLNTSDPTTPSNKFETLRAVACGDADPQTFDREAYKTFFADIVQRAPTLGPTWATYHLECTQWPVRPKWRYTGELAATNLSHPILIVEPAATNLSHPILIVEPKFDPAGPLHDALEVRKRYTGTGLLIQNSYGHTSVAAPSACTAKYVREYLEAGTMPVEGTVCEPDVLPLVGPVKSS